MIGTLSAFSLLMLLAVATESSAAPRTMRLDYYHTGDATHEEFSLDRIVLEPLPWPGNPRKAIDNTNLGKYFFEVIDQKTGEPIYSRGFASIYGEWETTGEAAKVMRTFSESLRFPAPASPVRIVLKKRVLTECGGIKRDPNWDPFFYHYSLGGVIIRNARRDSYRCRSYGPAPVRNNDHWIH